MFFYLTNLSLQRFFSEDVLELPKDTSDKEQFAVMEAWKHSNFLCKNYILSGLQDDLYNVYNSMKTSKELLNALEQKYITEDAGTKNSFVANSHNREVATFVKGLQNYFKHKSKEMSVEYLIVRLCIEEDNNAVEKRSKGNSAISRVNIVEDDPNNLKKRKKAVGKQSNPPKKKFKEKCFNCGQAGHNSVDYRAPKKDSGATRHICANKELFSAYAPAQAKEKIYMANSATAKHSGDGEIGDKEEEIKVGGGRGSLEEKKKEGVGVALVELGLDFSDAGEGDGKNYISAMEVKGMGKITGYNESYAWIDDTAASLMNRTATTTFSSLEPSKSLLIPNFGITSRLFIAYLIKMERNVVSVATSTGEVVTAEPTTTEMATTKLPSKLVQKIQEVWNKVDDKYAVSSLGVAAFILLWSSTRVISAIDRLPLIPSVLKLVGIGYTGELASGFINDSLVKLCTM
ncbi:Protein CURVATURE THYLAKOID 1B, chloroplastic [Capsicum annuum]|nr:Protein CURVATURE THYLAKOID 1B, chloroplastic [Capsicum annuum]